MTRETVLYEVRDFVATITLHRPDRLNAITRQLETELRAALQDANDSQDVRVIILTGAGRGFCAGADLALLAEVAETDFAEISPAEAKARFVPPTNPANAGPHFQGTYSYFPSLAKPLIAAINGAAVGLGFVLPLYCDLRFASDQARFGTAFAQRGLIAEHGISWMLPRLIGLSNALDLLYSARLISANEALRMGLVNEVFADDEMLDKVFDYAANLATSVSPRSLQIMKRQVYDAQFQTLAEAVNVANDELIASFQCDDFREGIAHFSEKRPPRFTGK